LRNNQGNNQGKKVVNVGKEYKTVLNHVVYEIEEKNPDL